VKNEMWPGAFSSYDVTAIFWSSGDATALPLDLPADGQPASRT